VWIEKEMALIVPGISHETHSISRTSWLNAKCVAVRQDRRFVDSPEIEAVHQVGSGHRID
jgi:hypothetical protein